MFCGALGAAALAPPAAFAVDRRRVRILSIANDYPAAGAMPHLPRTLAESTEFLRAASRLPRSETVAITQAPFADLQTRIGAFCEGQHSNDLVILHYAGHGIQVSNQNYLITQDDHAVSIQNVMRRLRGAYGDRVLVAFLNACRNNPFSDAEGEGLRLVRHNDLHDEGELISSADVSGEGLAKFDLRDDDQSRMFILFASALGRISQDNVTEDDDLSPFGRALVRHIGDRVNIQTLFTRIAADTEAATASQSGGVRQAPHWQASNTTEFWLAGHPRMRAVPL
jgi:uncharacterized caspase-like protein